MKLNNRAFAISTMLYLILILGLIIISCFLSVLSSRSKILNKLKNKVQNDINDNLDGNDYICVGTHTSKNFEVGDLYSCEVSNTETYNFYVLNSNEGFVNLVMSEAITFDIGSYGNYNDVKTESKVSYITDQDYAIYKIYNPVTALKVLKRITDNWLYLDFREDSVNNGLNEIDYNGYRARLISYDDISSYIQEGNLTIDFIGNTLTSSIYQDNLIYSINNGKVVTNKSVKNEFSIIPIITVNKQKMKN